MKPERTLDEAVHEHIWALSMLASGGGSNKVADYADLLMRSAKLIEALHESHKVRLELERAIEINEAAKGVQVATCKLCGQAFRTGHGTGRRRTADYCSHKCGDRAMYLKRKARLSGGDAA